MLSSMDSTSAPWEFATELCRFHAFFFGGVLLALCCGLGWIARCRKGRLKLLAAYFALVFVVVIVHLVVTWKLAAFDSRLSDEDDSAAQKSFYRLRDSLSQREILNGIRGRACSENTRFYLCLALRDRWRPPNELPESIWTELRRSPPIRPGFFSANHLNAPYLQRAIRGPAFEAVELVTAP